jgi:thiamine biosynthesis lipoprotein
MSSLFTLDALGTKWWIEIFSELTEEKSQTVYDGLRFLIFEFESNYSRFREDSKLSILNKHKYLDNPSDEFLELIKIGKKLYRDTDGVFNILSGEYLEAIGYDKTYSFTKKDNHVIRPKDPNTSIIFNEDKVTLSEGLIDIGGYGKGYLIDKIAKHLKNNEVNYFLINGGGDMYATSDFDRPITIYLEHPDNNETIIAETKLLNEGFAASSTKKRRWQKNGQDYSHIIDTNNGQSLITDSGIYIKAPFAVLADAWATTLVIAKPIKYSKILNEERVKLAIYEANSNNIEYYNGF